MQKPAVDSEKNAKMLLVFKILLIAFFAFGFPLAWVSFLNSPESLWKPGTRTKARLLVDNELVKQFITERGDTPENFNQLRAYAKGNKKNFYSYDGYGNRFEYIRLDAEHYVLRSFGIDGQQNTLNRSKDHAIINWRRAHKRGLVYQYPTAKAIDYYPAVLLAGVDSPNHVWSARTFVDNNANLRLIVRHRQKKNFHLIAKHDRVEEFLWLPSGYQIVYTATSSSRHRDGIFLWNLLDDTQVNLLDQIRDMSDIVPTSTKKGFWLSLAGVTLRGPTIYTYLARKTDGPLDPQRFFAPTSMVAFTVSEKRGHKTKYLPRQKMLKRLGVKVETDQEKIYEIGKYVLPTTEGLELQKFWLNLALEGDAGLVLEAWQRFSEAGDETPLYPYSLWFLSALFSEAFDEITLNNPKKAEVLRTYGAEISRALEGFELAPGYLKGIAKYTNALLMQGKPVPFKISKLTNVEPEKAKKTKKVVKPKVSKQKVVKKKPFKKEIRQKTAEPKVVPSYQAPSKPPEAQPVVKPKPKPLPKPVTKPKPKPIDKSVNTDKKSTSK